MNDLIKAEYGAFIIGFRAKKVIVDSDLAIFHNLRVKILGESSKKSKAHKL